MKRGALSWTLWAAGVAAAAGYVLLHARLFPEAAAVIRLLAAGR